MAAENSFDIACKIDMQEVTNALDQARREIARFIDVYNHRRRHSSCEMLSPVAYEALLAARAADTPPQPEAA